MTKDDILAALPHLSRTDLEAVHTMAGHLWRGTGAVAVPASPIAAMAFEALTAALGATVPYTSFKPNTARAFETRLGGLTAFLDLNFKGWDKNKIAQTAFLRMLFHLLASDLRKRGLRPTIGIMIVNLPRMPEVIDNAFPNYVEAGLASLILKSFQ